MAQINYNDLSQQSSDYLEQNMAVQTAATEMYGDNSDNTFVDTPFADNTFVDNMNAHFGNMHDGHAQLPIAPGPQWQYPNPQLRMQQFDSQSFYHNGIDQLSAAPNAFAPSQASQMALPPLQSSSAQRMLPAQLSVAPNTGSSVAPSGSLSHTCHLPDTCPARREARMALCRHLVSERNGRNKQYNCSSVGQNATARCVEEYLHGDPNNAHKDMYRRAQKTASQRAGRA